MEVLQTQTTPVTNRAGETRVSRCKLSFALLALLWIASGCATVAISPFQLYSNAIARANTALEGGLIDHAEWLDLSDRLLSQHIRGDFRVPAFIAQRRDIFADVDAGRLTPADGARRIGETFAQIKEDTEARFYAQQLDLKFADVMQDIRHKGAFAQSVAGDLGIVGGLALGRGRR